MLYPAHVYHPCDVSWLWVWWSGSRNTPSFHATETGMSIGLIDHLACIMQTLLYFTSCELYFIMYVLFLVVSCRWAKKQRLMFGMQAPWELCLCLKVFTGGASSVLTSQVYCTKDVKAAEICLSCFAIIALQTIAMRMKKKIQKSPCVWMRRWLIFKILSILYFYWSL